MAVANDRYCISVTKSRVEHKQLRSALSGYGYETRHAFLGQLLEQQWGEVSDSPVVGRVISFQFSRQFAEYTTFCSLNGALALHAAVERSRVAIVGMGGVGTNIAMQLARIGVSKFILIDGDRVDESNLNRQVLYYHSDLNKLKVTAARRELLRITGPGAEIQCHPQMLDSRSVAFCATADLAIVSADSSPSLVKQTVSSYCYPRKIPYVFAQYMGTSAIIGPAVLTFSDGCGCCLIHRTKPHEWILDLNLRSRPFIPASGMGMNGLIASLLLEIWTRALGGAGPTTGQWKADMASLTITHENSMRLNSCPVCGETPLHD